RAGGPRPPRARGRQLARALLAGADRALARRTRPGAGSRTQGCATGIHPRGARALVDDERHAGRSAAPSRAGGAPLCDTAALGPAGGAARLPGAGVAGAGHVAPPRTVFARSTQEKRRMTTHKIRLGVIGANPIVGWAPRAHLPALVASPDVELTA